MGKSDVEFPLKTKGMSGAFPSPWEWAELWIWSWFEADFGPIWGWFWADLRLILVCFTSEELQSHQANSLNGRNRNVKWENPDVQFPLESLMEKWRSDAFLPSRQWAELWIWSWFEGDLKVIWRGFEADFRLIWSRVEADLRLIWSRAEVDLKWI